MRADAVIVGTGVAGLYAALNLPEDKSVIVISKRDLESSDSFLAQGGICVLQNEDDYDDFFEDTLRAGHYENNRESVEIMIRSSKDVILDLVNYGADFEKTDHGFAYTKEGAHSKPRIMFHADETGKEITKNLLKAAKQRENITFIENYTVVDVLTKDNRCYGVVGHNENMEFSKIYAEYTVLATGGIGGLYKHSTNFPHLTGDALAIAIKNNIKLKNINYIQIHPTTLYTEKKGRAFLISESVRGEGAILLDAKGERFIDELLPRDVVTKGILEQMKKDNTPFVKMSFAPIEKEKIIKHFPHIYAHCLEEGYDVTKEPIPVVPAQHYYMGGIDVNRYSKTSMEGLYAAGETSCNGVHGKNRLASNSLLESLVFAKRAAEDISKNMAYDVNIPEIEVDFKNYDNYKEEYPKLVLSAIDKENENNE